MEKLVKKIDSSVLQLVSLDGCDLSDLANLHSDFQSISELAQASQAQAPEQLQFVESAGSVVADLIESIILDEVEDASAALETISQAAQSLQALVDQISQGQEPGDISFPVELGLEVPSANSSDNIGELPSSNLKIQLPDNVDEELFGEFLSALPHSLESLEAAILTAEADNTVENRAAIKAILHNLKGEAGLMGLTEMSGVCHDSETLLENAEDQFPGEKLLAANDWLNNTLAFLSGKDVATTPDDDMLELPEEAQAPSAQEQVEDSITIAESDVPLVMDFVNESQEHLESAESDLLAIEENPHDEETLNSIFRAFHTIKGVAGFLNLTQIGSLAHVTENLLDLARKGSIELSGLAVDVVFESIDQTKQLLDALRTAVDESTPFMNQAEVGPLIERIKACIEGDAVEAAPASNDSEQEAAVAEEDLCDTSKQSTEDESGSDCNDSAAEETEVVLEESAPVATQEQTVEPEQKTAAAKSPRMDMRKNSGSTVKVATSRLDSLINMVGELVIAQSMVSQNVSHLLTADQKLARNARHLDKITRDLQELTMSMRMVPVQGVFQKMARLVRDLSRKANKQIDFVMTGAETELDRNVVEAIADPLVHMVRNSIDHAIETPDQRKAAGKSTTGKIELKAYHQAGTIVIEIVDDGRGLDREKILKKAIANGIVTEGQDLSDAEVYRLIFHAGLSTAEKITNISGRGVGMDVVRKNIESLRGRIDIESTPGKGSRFSIHLPLTLAVIDGQIVTVGSETYIIPTVSIEQSLRPQKHQISSVQGGKGEMIMVRGELLPLVKLYELFGVEPECRETSESLVVVVIAGEERCCLQVDSLLGQQQVVIKSLGEFFGSLAGVSGGAIMGDGNVSLILDVPGLITLASNS